MWFELTLLTNYLKQYLNLVKNVGLDGFLGAMHIEHLRLLVFNRLFQLSSAKTNLS